MVHKLGIRYECILNDIVLFACVSLWMCMRASELVYIYICVLTTSTLVLYSKCWCRIWCTFVCFQVCVGGWIFSVTSQRNIRWKNEEGKNRNMCKCLLQNCTDCIALIIQIYFIDCDRIRNRIRLSPSHWMNLKFHFILSSFIVRW